MIIKEYGNYNEEEILSLYKAVGWTAYTKDTEALRRGYEHSLLILAACQGSDLLGIIRVVGDSATIVFIQDILVYPEHQGKGVGSALLRAVLDRFAGVRQIELVTDHTEKTIGFYRSMGFRALSELGCCGFMKYQQP